MQHTRVEVDKSCIQKKKKTFAFISLSFCIPLEGEQWRLSSPDEAPGSQKAMLSKDNIQRRGHNCTFFSVRKKQQKYL